MTVVSESSTSPCRVVTKIFLFMKQMCYFGFKFCKTLWNFQKKMTEDENIRGSLSNN